MTAARAVLMAVLLAACGDGGNDSVWTGLSGVLIFGVVAVIVVHYLKKRR